jgi:parallel beta-helix repeat protein
VHRPSAIAITALLLCGCSDKEGDGVLGEPPLTLSVGPSGSADHASIGAAIAAAPPGSTIVVEPGTYRELVSITKPLTLLGAGATTVVEYPAAGPLDSAVIEVEDVGGVRIEDLVVQASQPAVDGIRVRDATAVTLGALVARNNTGDGIDIKRSRGVSVTRSELHGNGGDGVQVDEGSTGVTITACLARANAVDGYKIRGSSDVLLEDSTATLNGDDGILVRDSTAVRLVGNSATGNFDWGISVLGSPDTLLDDNTTTGNGGGQIRCEPPPCSVP